MCDRLQNRHITTMTQVRIAWIHFKVSNVLNMLQRLNVLAVRNANENNLCLHAASESKT